MDIRECINKTMGDRNLSVRGLSKISGVRRQSIMAFLGGANLHLDNLKKILRALGKELQVVDIRTKEDLKIHGDLAIAQNELVKVCRKFGAKKLSLFGSVLRKDFGEESDIDILVEFKKAISFFELVIFEEELGKLFGGKYKPDVVTMGAISPHLRDDILGSCKVIYEEAA